MRWSRST